ncbi:hypothetical protein E4U36_006281 [Claviceps purpurea]|nr:hypothetical protein E4U36_006281 [Claviceps purpurea]
MPDPGPARAAPDTKLPSLSPRLASSDFIPSWDVAIETGQEDKIVVNGTIQQVDTYMEAQKGLTRSHPFYFLGSF